MLDLSTILVILAGAFLVYMFANQMGVSAVQNEGTVSVAPQGDSSDTPAYIPQMDVQAPSGGVEAGSDDPFAYPIPGNPADFTGAGVDRVNWDGLGENQLAGALSKQYQELSGDDLLPHNDIAHWADVYPNGVGQLSGKNFLHSGFHVGINTVGQSLKNANLQLRSEPPNPQVQHSIFSNSSISPDLLRRPLEVGSNCN